MYSAHTSYKLCLKTKDYKRCKALQRDAESKQDALEFPTIFAERYQRVVGFLSTFTSQGVLCAGPLVIEKSIKVPAILASRLISGYDNFMRHCGIVEYFFYVDKTNVKSWIRTMQHHGLSVYSEDENQLWFKRVLV